MNKPIRIEGFVVRNEHASSPLRFFQSQEEAELAAEKMLAGNMPTLVIPAVRFTTRAIQERTGEQ